MQPLSRVTGNNFLLQHMVCFSFNMSEMFPLIIFSILFAFLKMTFTHPSPESVSGFCII